MTESGSNSKLIRTVYIKTLAWGEVATVKIYYYADADAAGHPYPYNLDILIHNKNKAPEKIQLTHTTKPSNKYLNDLTQFIKRKSEYADKNHICYFTENE